MLLSLWRILTSQMAQRAQGLTQLPPLPQGGDGAGGICFEREVKLRALATLSKAKM